MNDGVTYYFCYGTLRIVWKFFSVSSFFPPLLVWVISDKCYGILQLPNDTSFKLCVIQSFAQSTCHINPIPSCTEYSWLTDWRVICYKCTCVGKFSLCVDDTPWYELGILKRASQAFEMYWFQFGKWHIIKSIWCGKAVVVLACSFENKISQLDAVCYNWFVSNADEGDTLFVTYIIIRCLVTRGDMQ